MKNRIEAHIKDYLHRYGKINLSGLGQFIVHNQQAEIVLADSKITPPTSILHFFPNIELDDNAFAKYLSIVEGTNEVVTADELNTYVRHIKDSLSKTNKSQIAGIGTLYNDGDVIVFTPENEIFSDVHRHLKPYLIKPITGKFISEYDSPQLSYQPKDTKPAWYYWIPFLLCLILSIFLICNLNKCRESNSNGGAISMVVDTTDANAVMNHSADSASNTSEAAPKDTMTGLDTETDTNMQSSITNEKVNTCIVILGSYKESKNSLKMIQRVGELQFELYTEEYNGFTRVGFQFDCSHTDLVDFIHHVRDEISKNAWYLVPRVTID